MPEVGKLSKSEALLVDRRRRGEDQGTAAERYRVTRHRYSLWERGLETPSVRPPALGRLEPHERCYLLRRRAGTSQAEVAATIGCCRWWVNQMERGDRPCGDLVEYWTS